MQKTLDLKKNINVEQLLNHIVDSGGSFLNYNPHMVIPRSILAKASSFTRDTINNCLFAGLIVEIPYAKNASEYNITPKGLKFILSKRKVNGQSMQ